MSHGYTMQVSEPGIFFEFYLPKKSRLQGALFRTLTNGFKLEEVKRHFRCLRLARDPSVIEKVRALTIPAWTMLQEELTQDEIEAFPRVFFGYSMYEVDGVYNQEVGHATGDPDSNYMLAEERTQIIRLIFKFPGADLDMETLDMLKAAMRDPRAGPTALRRRSGEIVKAESPKAREALSSLIQWVRYIGWFVFGYLLYQVCEEIESQYASELRDGERAGSEAVQQSIVATVKQEEIWITSLSNLSINVLRWAGSPV
jgi:hypothetical protein